MNEVLLDLAKLYRQSAQGSSVSRSDFICDYEKFLRKFGRDDGEEREEAERELLAAEGMAGGLFVIDRHSRSGAKERLRLKAEGGEEWLFGLIGECSPKEERQVLATFFEQAGSGKVAEVWQERWRIWCVQLAEAARTGKTLGAFVRDDPAGNADLMQALQGVLSWSSDSYVRYASAVICGNSKTLEKLRPRLESALRKLTGRKMAGLADFGISDTPRCVRVHGPLRLMKKEGCVDVGLLKGVTALSEVDIRESECLQCPSGFCLTVENETVFHELSACQSGVLLVQTSFPGAATRALLERLPAEVRVAHFGDTDPAGFAILGDLREKAGRWIEPFLMTYRPDAQSARLNEIERRELMRLLEMNHLTDVKAELLALQQIGRKGDFEQETWPWEQVLKELASWRDG